MQNTFNLIFDVSNMFYRAYHTYMRTIPDFDLDIQKYNDMMVRKFVMDCVAISKLVPINNLYFCFDDDTFRKQVDPAYKANREEKKESFVDCIQQIYKLLKFKNLNAIQINGLEADDCIALLTEKLEGPNIAISADDDIKQLINENTMVLTPVAKTRTLYVSITTPENNIPTINGVLHVVYLPDHLLTEKLLKGCHGDNIAPLAPKGFRLKKVEEIANKYIVEKKSTDDEFAELSIFSKILPEYFDFNEDDLVKQFILVCLKSKFMPDNLVEEFKKYPLLEKRLIDLELSTILANTRYWDEGYKKLA